MRNKIEKHLPKLTKRKDQTNKLRDKMWAITTDIGENKKIIRIYLKSYIILNCKFKWNG